MKKLHKILSQLAPIQLDELCERGNRHAKFMSVFTAWMINSLSDVWTGTNLSIAQAARECMRACNHSKTQSNTISGLEPVAVFVCELQVCVWLNCVVNDGEICQRKYSNLYNIYELFLSWRNFSRSTVYSVCAPINGNLKCIAIQLPIQTKIEIVWRSFFNRRTTSRCSNQVLSNFLWIQFRLNSPVADAIIVCAYCNFRRQI